MFAFDRCGLILNSVIPTSSLFFRKLLFQIFSVCFTISYHHNNFSLLIFNFNSISVCSEMKQKRNQIKFIKCCSLITVLFPFKSRFYKYCNSFFPYHNYQNILSFHIIFAKLNSIFRWFSV
jgi:hypothetical protein